MLDKKATTLSAWSTGHTLSLVVILVSGTALELLMPGSARVLTWLCVMGLMAVFGVIVGHGITRRWLGLLIDTERKVSLCQERWEVSPDQRNEMSSDHRSKCPLNSTLL